MSISKHQILLFLESTFDSWTQTHKQTGRALNFDMVGGLMAFCWLLPTPAIADGLFREELHLMDEVS